MKRIPVGDFRLGEDEKKAIWDVLERGRLSEGPITRDFERLFAEYVGTKHCVAVSSGTAALICLLTALAYDDRFPRFRKGKKVITTPLTYVSTTNAIVLSGLAPVFVDVDRRTFGMLPEKVEELLAGSDPEEYCAILPVHLMGYPCDMAALDRIAKTYDLVLLEDAAQAHGSVYQGRRCGSLGQAGIFSFYIAHNIQAGEMGCVTTDDAELARLVKKIKANGRECDCAVCTRALNVCPRLPGDESSEVIDLDPRFRHEIIGYNFKVMEFQPALAITQLKKADEIFRRRLENVRFLNERLAGLSGTLVIPVHDEQVSYLAYPLVVREESGIGRGKLRMRLRALGVETRPLFGCIPLHQPAYAEYREAYRGRLPHAEHLGRQAFYLGCHQYLDEGDMAYVAEAVQRTVRMERL
jgi:perosamine synthetase